MWIARDIDGNLFLYTTKPIRDLSGCGWISIKPCESLKINSKLFPELTWEDEPLEIKLVENF